MYSCVVLTLCTAWKLNWLSVHGCCINSAYRDVVQFYAEGCNTDSVYKCDVLTFRTVMLYWLVVQGCWTDSVFRSVVMTLCTWFCTDSLCVTWVSYWLLEQWCIQEVFHVYLNKFENAVTHLFLVIFGNNWFPWDSLISRNTQPSRKQFLIFIFWFETVPEDE